MPPACDDLAILRVCVRDGFSRDLASLLLTDLQRALSRVERLAGHLSGPVAPRSITGIPAPMARTAVPLPVCGYPAPREWLSTDGRAQRSAYGGVGRDHQDAGSAHGADERLTNDSLDRSWASPWRKD